jgi:hypothetical protein
MYEPPACGLDEGLNGLTVKKLKLRNFARRLGLGLILWTTQEWKINIRFVSWIVGVSVSQTTESVDNSTGEISVRFSANSGINMR